MFPGKINPRQMQSMMRQMGIKTEEIPATRVIFELADKRLVIDEPHVTAMDVQGQKTYTVNGEAREEAVAQKAYAPADEDIQMVAGQAECSAEEAKAALLETKGDLAEAILRAKKSE